MTNTKGLYLVLNPMWNPGRYGLGVVNVCTRRLSGQITVYLSERIRRVRIPLSYSPSPTTASFHRRVNEANSFRTSSLFPLRQDAVLISYRPARTNNDSHDALSLPLQPPACRAGAPSTSDGSVVRRDEAGCDTVHGEVAEHARVLRFAASGGAGAGRDEEVGEGEDG